MPDAARPSPLFDPHRASDAMASRGIDVVLATTRTNVGYLAGGYFCHHIARLPFHLEDGGHYDIIAAVACDPDTSPFLTPCTGEHGEITSDLCWIEDLRYCGPPFVISGGATERANYPDAATAAVAALRERGLERGTIGVEMNDIPTGLLDRLREQLPAATFVNGEPALWQMRMIKSAFEIERCRRAAEATEAGIEAVWNRLEPGLNEREADQIPLETIAQHGARRDKSMMNVVFDWSDA